MNANQAEQPARKRFSSGPHTYVLERMSEVPPEKRAGIKVLDVPAGRGLISLPLKAAGFDVTGCDLFPEYLDQTLANVNGATVEELFLLFNRGAFSRSLIQRLFREPRAVVPTDLRCVAGDMEERLPFAGGEFDYVICMEGIEHVKDRHKVLAELRRLLKPQGTLLISTPNMLSLRSRLAYALAGQRTFKGHLDEHTGVSGRSSDGKRIYHGHAFLVNYFQLRYGLHHSGFRIRRQLWSNLSPTSVVLLPFLYPWVALFTWRSQRHGRKRFAIMKARGEIPADTQAPYAELVRAVLSPKMMLTTVMVLEAEAT